MKIGFTVLAGISMFVFVIGCAEQSGTNSDTEHGEEHAHHGEAGEVQAPVAPSAEGEKYVLEEAPAEPQGVIAARESLGDNEEVVLTGRIGGSQNPWIEGRAMFTIVDDSLQSCDQIPGDSCPTPWDYCCATDKLPQASALVQLVDANGKPVEVDARELLGVRELTQVIVQGKSERDDAGNLTVLATGVYVKK